MMSPRHQVSRSAVNLIKSFEGLRLDAAQLPSGRWTIGYSHTATAREGASVSEPDAEALLLYDLIFVTHAVGEYVYAPLSQNQFDALTSFAFNIGVDNFRRSAALRRLNEGNYLQAASAMELWRKADFEGERIIIDALVRRRAAEKSLFLTPPDGWVPASSPVLPPLLDFDPNYAASAQSARAVETPLGQTRAFAQASAEPAPLVTPVEDQPSAAENAAAAVTARLQTLFPDEAEASTAEPQVAEVPPTAPVESPFELTPMEEPAVDEPGETETLAETETPAEPDLFEVIEAPATEPPAVSPTAEAVTTTPAADDNRITGERLAFLGLLGLAALGIGVFVAAVFVGLQNATEARGLMNPMTWAWVLGALAVLCFGTAAFFLLDRMNGDDDGNGPVA